ncbi:MAG: GNAT family N-acetyltransferase [Planctomycetota bacterium]|jgi:CelD/BcsL family acetyltransferase involved in cellulose biosynthesis
MGHDEGEQVGVAVREGSHTVSSPDRRVLVIDRVEDLRRHAAAWNALAFDAPPRIPTSSYAWVSAYFEHCLAPGETWRCVLAYDRGEDRLVGVLPLIAAGGFLRRSLRTPHDGHTIAVGPLLAPGDETSVLDALLRAAWASEPRALWIEVADVVEGSPLVTRLDARLHLELTRRPGAFLRVDGDQEQYQASLSKNFRSNQRKAANKLKKLADVETAFLTGEDASSAQLPEFAPVEASGWKGRENSAIQASPERMAFYATLADRLAEAGWLEWHFLRAEGKAVAANLAVRFNRSILVWKLAYDEAHARCSPGGMLFQALVDRTFPDPFIDEINLLTDAPWYGNWRMEKREFLRLRLYRRRPGSLLLGLVPDGLAARARRSRTLRSAVQAVRRWLSRGR